MIAKIFDRNKKYIVSPRQSGFSISSPEFVATVFFASLLAFLVLPYLQQSQATTVSRSGDTKADNIVHSVHEYLDLPHPTLLEHLDVLLSCLAVRDLGENIDRIAQLGLQVNEMS